jgi:phosphoserine phosphatase RsbU/P
MRRAPLDRVQALPDCAFVNPTARAAWELGGFRLRAECRSADDGELGGDFYAFRLLGPERLAVVIGDACGRGRDGASLLPSVLSRLEQVVATGVKPSHFLYELNRLLVQELASDRFVTGLAFEVDGSSGTLTVANAGHVPAVLRRASGKVSMIGRASGPPLGMLEDSSYFDETYRFEEGDVIVLMTDGVLEAVETDLANMPRLLAAVAQGVGESAAVHGRLLAELGSRALHDPDNMTLLNLERVPSTLPVTTHQPIQ